MILVTRMALNDSDDDSDDHSDDQTRLDESDGDSDDRSARDPAPDTWGAQN